MVEISTILKPNGFKILLFALVFIPILAILIMILELINPGYLNNFIFIDLLNYLQTLFIPILFSLIFAYILASIIDHYIPNKNIKVTIAVISGLISLIILYIFYKIVTEPVVCDPVHKPPQTNYHSNIFNNLKVDKKIVGESLKQCLSGLNK